ncbi:hypothetical protein Q3G72_014130 [Acer saccharum]|nr:hypothetical protein Q3G72_014130 [Acer saccharum]
MHHLSRLKAAVLTRQVLPAWCVGICACLLYSQHLPSTVQALDSGELVLSAWGRFVPHPPGYPLFVWLDALCIAVLPFGTVFWRACALSACAAGWVLGVVYQSSRRRLLALCVIVGPLALHPIFWRYALVADVFMLNAALLCLVCALTRDAPQRPWDVHRIALVFGLGLGNHQTLIFALPIIVWYALALDCQRRFIVMLQAAVLSAGAGAAIYVSLLLLDVEDMASWGRLDSLAALVSHVLRSDYGSLRLSPRNEAMGGIKHSLQCLWQMFAVAPVIGAIVIYAPWGLWPQRRTYQGRRIYALWAALALYVCIFIPATNTTHPGVLERFFLLAVVWSSLIAALCIDHIGLCRLRTTAARRLRAIAYITSAGAAMLHLMHYHTALNLQTETIVEDYALNLLQSIPQGRPSILVVHGDTRLHAVRYAQYVLGVRKDVILLSRTALTPKSRDKWALAQPQLRLPPFAPQTQEPQYVRRLFELNYRDFNIVTADTRGIDTRDLHVAFTGLGRLLTPGSGIDVDWPCVQRMQRRSNTSRLVDSQIFQEEFDLFAAYAYPYLAAATMVSQPVVARKYLQSALLLVPYCLPAHYELCLREAPDNEVACQRRMQKLQASVGDYF